MAELERMRMTKGLTKEGNRVEDETTNAMSFTPPGTGSAGSGSAPSPPGQRMVTTRGWSDAGGWGGNAVGGW